MFLKDDKVLTKLAVGDIVANGLKYHAMCLVVFRRRYDEAICKITDDDDTIRKPIEEMLAVIDEDISLGRTCFPLKEIHKEVCQRKKHLGDCSDINRTRLKEIVLERFPILKEELGFRREVLLVTIPELKDLVTSSYKTKSLTDDYRMLANVALICRREIVKHCKNNSFSVIKDGFPEQCQETSVPDALEFLLRMIINGPASENNSDTKQGILSIAQLICFHCTKKAKVSTCNETPLPVYLGFLIHSQFRSSQFVDDLAGLGLSISYSRVLYLEKKLGHKVLEQFANEKVVCPSNLRRGLFTVAAVDNIDHNPSSTTSSGSFHGTAISLFQARTCIDDGEKRELPISETGHMKISLPDEYTTIPSLCYKPKCSLPDR